MTESTSTTTDEVAATHERQRPSRTPSGHRAGVAITTSVADSPIA